MLFKLSDKISECLAQAANARECARAATDPSRKADHLDMELRWLRLVENYRFVEQASRFLEDAHSRGHPSSEKPSREGVLVVRCPTTGREFSTGILTDTDSLALLPQEFIHSRCPHCNVEHSWWSKDAKLVSALPSTVQLEIPSGTSLNALLDVLVRAAIEYAEGKARAAFYVANASGTGLHHVVGMPEAYARRVDGFAIGPQSLACGLAAAIRLPVITPDVIEEPRWKPWLGLAQEFDYRACWSFPIETPTGKIAGTLAMYYKEPREATPRDLDVAAVLTRTAGAIISRL